MNFSLVAKCGGVVLLGALILTCGVEVLKSESIYTGKLGQSILENYKQTLWQILYAFGWMVALGLSVQVVFVCYNGGRMTYLFTVESVEKVNDLFHNRLPTMELVYESKVLAPPAVPTLQLDPPPQPSQPSQPLELREATLSIPYAHPRRRRSPRNLYR